MKNNKVEFLINMINDMDIKDKLSLAICMSQSKWSGLIYNTKENYEKFDKMLKDIDENGVEFWYARDLMPILQYAKWQNFKKIIDKAMIACQNSEISIEDCFTDISKPIISGKGKQELIEDYKLTRYACYLIAQNGDSRKKVIALPQTYFAVQTRC